MRKALVWFSCLALIGAMFMVVGCDDSDSTTYIAPETQPETNSYTGEQQEDYKGTYTEPYVIKTTDASGTVKTSAEVTLGTGTTLVDESGNPIKAGKIKISTKTTDPTTSTEGTTLGQFQLNITDEAGNPVGVSGDTVVKFEVNEEEFTKMGLKEGDSISFQYVDPTTGKQVVKAVVLTKNAAGKLVISTKNADGSLTEGVKINNVSPKGMNFTLMPFQSPTSA